MSGMGETGAGLRGLLERLIARGLSGEHGRDRLHAATAFLTRVAGAGILYLTQALLARWIGSHEFGLYVYAWTLVIIAGDLVPSGFAFASQRIIPELRHAGDLQALRGFLLASRAYAFLAGTLVALVAAAFVLSFPDHFREQGVWVLVFAASALPPQALANVQDGVARTFNQTNMALVPGFIVRPLLIILFMAALHLTGLASSAVSVTAAASVSTWIIALGQMFVLDRHIRGVIPAGARALGDFRRWLGVALGIVTSWACLTLFTYTDMLVLNQFSTPDKVAVYYATVKTLALTSFVTFAIAAVVGHRFVSLHVAGDREGLNRMVGFAVKWTFWPSLAITLAMLAVGKPVLSLFGKDFTVGYQLLFILSAGMMARASVGPAERILNMLGEERACALVYVGAFVATLTFCLVLVPLYGLYGAAVGSSLGMFVEAASLWWAVRRRLGLNAFVLR
jgi:O-antigen/teichoic acid export membrane protein